MTQRSCFSVPDSDSQRGVQREDVSAGVIHGVRARVSSGVIGVVRSGIACCELFYR